MWKKTKLKKYPQKIKHNVCMDKFKINFENEIGCFVFWSKKKSKDVVMLDTRKFSAHIKVFFLKRKPVEYKRYSFYFTIHLYTYHTHI